MKKTVLFLIMTICAYAGNSQIISPTIQGKFGIDADAQHNIFVVPASPCSDCDDWWYPQVNNGNNSMFVIDTTGAGAIVANYLANPAAYNNIPFYRKMSYPAFYQTNQRTLIDAVFVRDYHGVDQTTFVSGSNKNGDSPAAWTGGTTNNLITKNEILDTYLHLRRQGPNYNPSDSLWLYGAIAVEGVNGDRYFDFELYQTDIFFTRSTGKFTGYGPDAGHTAWKFDAAGNVTQAGDMIFAADYSSSALSGIEARIWVDQAALTTTPANFSWTGLFDGGPQYGYAQIVPNNGAPFYFGTENSGSTWAGPFMCPRANGSIVTQYANGQFMEFGINLTILGLDPVSLMGKTPCGIPFSKVMVKTRSSLSFTSELKDFISPFDFFLPPAVNVAANMPVICGASGVANISVVDPFSTSIYTWSTANGNILSNQGDTTITVNKAGTYKVIQTLESGCPVYAADSASITYDPTCVTLASNKINLTGVLNNGVVGLDWSVTSNNEVKYFTIERSTDGVNYTLVGKVNADTRSTYASYKANDGVFGLSASKVYYRIIVTGDNGDITYSKVVELSLAVDKLSVTLAPNPVKDVVSVNIASNTDKQVQVFIYDVSGKLMRSTNARAQKGYSTIKMSDLGSWARGVYSVKVVSGNDVFVERMLLTK